MVQSDADSCWGVHPCLRTALNAARVGTWRWEPVCGVSYWDSRMYELTGVPVVTGSKIGTSMSSILHPDDKARFDQNIAQAFTSGEPLCHEFRIIRPDTGETKWLAGRGGLIHKEDQSIEMVGIIFDVTELKEREVSLDIKYRVATEFIAMLSHELKAPMAPIMTALELLSRTPDHHIFKSAVAVIRRQAIKIQRLVDELLDMTRVTSDRFQLREETVDVSLAVKSAIETTDHLITQKNHRLVLDLSDCAIITGDNIRVIQIATNLIQNAAKYTQDNGTIQVSVHDTPSTVVIDVSDDGPGIPTDMLDSIFDMYAQVRTTVQYSAGGLGIGLAIVKKLVEMHGGEIHVTNTALAGAKFTVTLPKKLTS
jgi:signal transduction histidine kinase